MTTTAPPPPTNILNPVDETTTIPIPTSDLTSLIRLLVDSSPQTLLVQISDSIRTQHLDHVPNTISHIDLQTVCTNLLKLLHVPNIQPKLKSSLMTCLSSACAHFAFDECVPDLIPILANFQAEQVTVVDDACTALSHLAKKSYSIKHTIRTQNGITHLCSILASCSDPDVQLASMQALYALMGDYLCRHCIRDSNGQSIMITKLTSEFPEIQDMAIQALIKLCQDDQTKIQMRTNPLIETLTTILLQQNPTTISLLELLATCAQDQYLASTIAHSCTVPLLAQLSKQDYGCVIGALCVFTNLFSHMNSKLVPDTLVSLLVPFLLPNVDMAVFSACALAIHKLAFLPNGILGDQGPRVLELICQKVLDSTALPPDALKAGLLALASLLMQDQLRAKFRSLGGASTLSNLNKLLTHTSMDVCALVLGALALDDQIRQDLISLNIVSTLLAKISSMTNTSDTAHYPNFLLTLANFFVSENNQQAQSQFLENDGPRLILALLNPSMHSTKTVQSACLVISRTCTLAPISIQFTNLQAPLLLTGLLPTHVCAVPALDRLLDNHLPCRWWMKGLLAPAHKILTNGGSMEPFYDCQCTYTPESKFTFASLEQYKKAPIDTRLPIIEVSVADPLIQMIMGIIIASDANTTMMDKIKTIISQMRLKWGDVPTKPTTTFPLTQIKYQLGSNVVPLHMMPSASISVRALTMKACCDLIDVPCSLTRGSNGRVWNQVVVSDHVCGLIDLESMTNLILPLNSPEAAKYKQ